MTNPAPHHSPAMPSLPVRAARSALRRVRVIFRGHRIWQVVLDATMVAAAYWLAFWVRFDTGTPIFYERTMMQTIGVVVAIKILVFVFTDMYDKWWRYLSVKDMESVARSVVLGSLATIAYLALLSPEGAARVPRSVMVYDFVFTLIGVAGVRFVVRSIYERPHLRARRADGASHATPNAHGVLIVGAGEAGRVIVRELQRHDLGLNPLGFIDDDARKQHTKLDGIEVLGTTEEIAEIAAAAGATEVVIAMPSATGEAIQRVVRLCRESNLACRILPSIHELVLGGGRSLAGQLRTVQVEDILGRDPVQVDLRQVASFLQDKVVLITGAGGSIGSELCRQVARANPRHLVLVDNGEHNIFTIEQELVHERGVENLTAVLADVTNTARMRNVMRRFTPQVVFHAAAYKHVPMIEHNPIEAVRANVMGTRVMCELAAETGAERFVLVSTDKAVEPQTVMGQSKALAEQIVRAWAQQAPRTRFMAVRFGNVLGSSGSVVPIFRKQIEAGGPVRVTDERMTRFFMTIPEAVQLIIQAGAQGDGGEIFVLDMGTPVKIIDLARNMIELSGKVPDVDVMIEIVGIRPGEKLHEELFSGDESVERTRHEKIYRSQPAEALDAADLLNRVDLLSKFVLADDMERVVVQLREILASRISAGAKSHADDEDDVAAHGLTLTSALIDNA